ncbi:hypothetical protein F442_01068 [Phytophthora nicotianae P10297]|uniref:FAR1 domain-containing protein n=2 Tax=Phytophthora nicotianae TaxID=4792 RepID=W3A3D6_PHYNI|nr:hypothetical protein L917_01012 [Phytophthora nicotianae]ETP54098.1 hypothetical protein F442_01068 [Phytophthora nicotianae P10297]
MPRRRASVSDESDGFSASDTSSSEKSSSSDDSGNHRSSQSHRHKRSRQEGTLAASEDASGQGESVSDSVVSEGESCGEAVAVRTELEHVPELDVKIFEAWDALEAYLKNYSRRIHPQIYSVRACITANTRDQRIKASKSPLRLILPEITIYNKTFVWTHSGTPRRGRNQGSRPNQHSRKIRCRAQINACVRESGNWEVCITGQRTGHNHEVGQEIYKIYRESRQVTDNEVRSAVRTLHRAGANRKRILEYITENTSVNPTMKDVHNLVERL